MHDSRGTNSGCRPSYDARMPRPFSDPAQPFQRGEFGSVMEQEHDLQSSTGGYRGEGNGHLSATIARVLSKQQVALGANIALLEQRCELLPQAAQVLALHGRHSPLTKARHRAPAPEHNSLLRNLIARHLDVMEDIDTLITEGSNGLGGELILREISRNHEDMAGMLSALLKEDESVRERPAITGMGAAGTKAGQGENEGGNPAVSPALDAAINRPAA